MDIKIIGGSAEVKKARIPKFKITKTRKEILPVFNEQASVLKAEKLAKKEALTQAKLDKKAEKQAEIQARLEKKIEKKLTKKTTARPVKVKKEAVAPVQNKELQKVFVRASKSKKGFASLYIEHKESKKAPHFTMRQAMTGFAVLVAVAVLGAIGNIAFMSSALPNTFVADINISGLNKNQIADKLAESFESTEVAIISGDNRSYASLDNLGIEIDYEKIAENAINLEGERSFFSIFNVFRKSVDVIADFNLDKADSFLVRNFADIEIRATSAEVVWNESRHIFEVLPSTRGRSLSSETITARTVSFLSSIDLIEIYAVPVEVVPEIETPDADIIKDYLNNEILGLGRDIPPIANTRSAQMMRDMASQRLSETTSNSYQELAVVATSTLIRR